MNLYGFVENEGISNWDYLGLEKLKLWYEVSQKILLGECGSFSWIIQWHVEPKSGNDGGIVLQEIDAQAEDDEGNKLLEKNYWEAWRVMPNTRSVVNNVSVLDGREAVGFGDGKDYWRLGGVDASSPAYDETQGTATIKGWARYRSPIILDDLNSKMPRETEPYAYDLWSSLTNPNFGTADKSDLVYRELKIKWCCKEGATSEERKTKVVEIFPESDKIYLP